MKRIFVGMPPFEKEWARLRLDDGLRLAVEQTLLLDPSAGVLIKETGGVRKLRAAVRGKGKSGGVRIFYFDHKPTEHIFFMAIILKGEQENLSKAERNILRTLVEGIAGVKPRRRQP